MACVGTVPLSVEEGKQLGRVLAAWEDDLRDFPIEVAMRGGIGYGRLRGIGATPAGCYAIIDWKQDPSTQCQGWPCACLGDCRFSFCIDTGLVISRSGEEMFPFWSPLSPSQNWRSLLLAVPFWHQMARKLTGFQFMGEGQRWPEEQQADWQTGLIDPLTLHEMAGRLEEKAKDAFKVAWLEMEVPASFVEPALNRWIEKYGIGYDEGLPWDGFAKICQAPYQAVKSAIRAHALYAMNMNDLFSRKALRESLAELLGVSRVEISDCIRIVQVSEIWKGPDMDAIQALCFPDLRSQ